MKGRFIYFTRNRKRLEHAESKPEIVTNWYGVGAVIMYGGLKSELDGHVNEKYNDNDDEDVRWGGEMMVKALESLVDLR